MQVTYCDLCAQPLKTERYVVCIIQDSTFQQGFTHPINSSHQKVTYEVCGSCIDDIHKIFTLKKESANEVLDYIKETYGLPAKEKEGEKDG